MANCAVTVQPATCTVCAVARQYTVLTANAATYVCEDCLGALVRIIQDAKVQGYRTGVGTAFTTAVDTALAEEGGRGHI